MTLSQLRFGYFCLLNSYMHRIDTQIDVSPACGKTPLKASYRMPKKFYAAEHKIGMDKPHRSDYVPWLVNRLRRMNDSVKQLERWKSTNLRLSHLTVTIYHYQPNSNTTSCGWYRILAHERDERIPQTEELQNLTEKLPNLQMTTTKWNEHLQSVTFNAGPKNLWKTNKGLN